MTIKRYTKRAVTVEVIEFDGYNETEILEWAEGNVHIVKPGLLGVETLEGTMHARLGDYIIKGVIGEFYPCKPEAFEATFDPAS